MSTPVKFTAVLFLVVAAFVAGKWADQMPAAAAVASNSPRKVLYWACPMHPQYKSGHAGDCFSCGMRLAAVYADDVGPSYAAAREIPGAVRVSSLKQQLIGVRTDEVRPAGGSYLLRAPGRVTVDEERQYRLIAAADGWIRTLGANSAGVFVKKNQLLASYYTANLVSAAQSFMLALGTNAQPQTGDLRVRYQRGTTTLSLQLALNSLRTLGMSELQLEEIQRTREAPVEVNLYSPIDGFVISRSISPKQRFDVGSELYRIADIGHVWVTADIFRQDYEFVKPGTTATIHYGNRKFTARMSNALPLVDPQSRTLKTRFELDNPGYLLRPDMFVDVELHPEMPTAITVPADAVIDTGLRKTVFVESEKGMFEPRLVETGWRLGNRIEITSGLEPGERFVASGNFLLDSESRMKLGAVTTASAAENVALGKDPVCGMKVDAKAPDAIMIQYGSGTTYYFCSDKCKKDFEANPGKYVHQPMPAQGGAGERRGPV